MIQSHQTSLTHISNTSCTSMTIFFYIFIMINLVEACEMRIWVLSIFSKNCVLFEIKLMTSVLNWKFGFHEDKDSQLIFTFGGIKCSTSTLFLSISRFAIACFNHYLASLCFLIENLNKEKRVNWIKKK